MTRTWLRLLQRLGLVGKRRRRRCVTVTGGSAEWLLRNYLPVTPFSVSISPPKPKQGSSNNDHESHCLNQDWLFLSFFFTPPSSSSSTTPVLPFPPPPRFGCAVECKAIHFPANDLWKRLCRGSIRRPELSSFNEGPFFVFQVA